MNTSATLEPGLGGRCLGDTERGEPTRRVEDPGCREPGVKKRGLVERDAGWVSSSGAQLGPGTGVLAADRFEVVNGLPNASLPVDGFLRRLGLGERCFLIRGEDG